MRKLALVLISILLTISLGCGMPTAFADTANNLDTTDVLADLKSSVIDGIEFNASNYGYSNVKEPRVLAFAEFGFCYDSNKQADYSIYIYVYNPGGQAIGLERNAISIATVYENGGAVDYEKFALKLLSVSDGSYDRLFYKFKVVDVSKLLARITENTSLRRYDVGEIELNFGDTTSKAFNVSNYYEYSGFAKGYGADLNAESTLICKSDSLEALRLNVNSTYYRYNNGVTSQDNLSSVYFGVPTKTLETYGKLQQIKANWYEVHTSGYQLLIDNRSLYDELQAASEAKRSPNLSKFDYTGLVVKWSSGTTIAGYGEFAKPVGGITGTGYVGPLDFDWLFYSKTNQVSADTVLQYAKDYTAKNGGELILDKYSKVLFNTSADNGRQAGWQGTDGTGITIDIDSKFDINGFTMSDKFLDWWTKLFYKDLETNPIMNVEPIKIVEDRDIVGSAAEIAERLLITENDVATFVSEYKANKIAGKTTVLFRFALTNYNAFDLFAEKYNSVFGTLKQDKIGYAASQTAFLDFDIIWLKFVKEGVETVIPIVSSPTDIISGLTPPLEADPFAWLKNLWEWLKENWWVIVVGVVGILLIVSLSFNVLREGLWIVIKAIGKGVGYLIKYIFIALYYILASPVYLIAWIVRKIKNR